MNNKMKAKIPTIQGNSFNNFVKIITSRWKECQEAKNLIADVPNVLALMQKDKKEILLTRQMGNNVDFHYGTKVVNAALKVALTKWYIENNMTSGYWKSFALSPVLLGVIDGEHKSYDFRLLKPLSEAKEPLKDVAISSLSVTPHEIKIEGHTHDLQMGMLNHRSRPMTDDEVTAKLFGGLPTRDKPVYGKFIQDQLSQTVALDLSEIEKRVYAATFPELAHPFAAMNADEIAQAFRESVHEAFDKPINNTVKLTLPREITDMSQFEIKRPIMVGNINILEASDETLVRLIRDAKCHKEEISDMVEVSTKFQKQDKKLDTVITLLIKHLDKA